MRAYGWRSGAGWCCSGHVPANSTKNGTTGDCTCNATTTTKTAHACQLVRRQRDLQRHNVRLIRLCTVTVFAQRRTRLARGLHWHASNEFTPRRCATTIANTFNTAQSVPERRCLEIWYGSTPSSGAFCSGGETAASNPATAPSCPQGQVPGTINGAFACLPSSPIRKD